MIRLLRNLFPLLAFGAGALLSDALFELPKVEVPEGGNLLPEIPPTYDTAPVQTALDTLRKRYQKKQEPVAKQGATAVDWRFVGVTRDGQGYVALISQGQQVKRYRAGEKLPDGSELVGIDLNSVQVLKGAVFAEVPLYIATAPPEAAAAKGAPRAGGGDHRLPGGGLPPGAMEHGPGRAQPGGGARGGAQARPQRGVGAGNPRGSPGGGAAGAGGQHGAASTAAQGRKAGGK